MADEMNKFSNSLGPTSVRTNNLRQLIRKCPALTLAVLDIANGSPAFSPSRRRLEPAGLEGVGNIGCADVSTARGTQDRSLFPVQLQRSPNDRRPARPQESASLAREPNPCFFAYSLIGETPNQTNQHRK